MALFSLTCSRQSQTVHFSRFIIRIVCVCVCVLHYCSGLFTLALLFRFSDQITLRLAQSTMIASCPRNAVELIATMRQEQRDIYDINIYIYIYM